MTALDLDALVRAEVAEAIQLRQTVLGDVALIERTARLARDIAAALRHGGKAIFAGNGGSFADAQHLAAEMVGRFLREREPLAAICLGTNGSLLTSVGNDYSYGDVFTRELKALGKPPDVFIAISTSGNSANLVAAVDLARARGITTYALLGRDGGKIGRQLPDTSLVVPSNATPRIQEMHITLGHVVCGLVDRMLEASDEGG